MSSHGLGLRIVLVCVASGMLSLTGCGGSGTPSPISCGLVCNGGGGSTGSVGVVHAGAQAVVGATVQLYAVGSTGNGSAATPMLAKTLITDSSGDFSLTGAYACGQSSSGASIPSPSNQVYLVATGGSVGGGTANSSLVLMTALGTCSGVGALGTITVNEVTTAAAAWALAPFTVSATNIGGSATNTLGLQNAFLNAGLLASVTTGNAAALSTGLTVESGKLYSLANALSGCAVSSGGTGCSALFAAATPAGGTAPANTLTAALNIVKHPGQNVAPVFQAAAAMHSYSGALTAAPSDWTMSLKVTGGGLSLPTALAVDAQNNVWVAGQAGPLSAFGPQGAPLSASGFGAGQITQAYSIAIDTLGDIWVTNYNATYNTTGAVTKFLGSNSSTPGAVVLNGSGQPGFYDSSLQFPYAVSSDTHGNIYIANNDCCSATEYNSAGALVNGDLGLGTGLFAFPEAIAADANNGFWLSDGDDTIAHIVPSGMASPNGTLVSHPSCCVETYGLATDSSGNVWVADYEGGATGTGGLAEVRGSDGGVQIAGTSGAAGNGGLQYPAFVAVDAAQNVWVTNFGGASFSEFAANPGVVGGPAVAVALSPTGTGLGTGGYGRDAGLRSPYSIAPDRAGNIWVSDEGQSTVFMFFGLATPTVTPVQPSPAAP